MYYTSSTFLWIQAYKIIFETIKWGTKKDIKTFTFASVILVLEGLIVSKVK